MRGLERELGKVLRKAATNGRRATSRGETPVTSRRRRRRATASGAPASPATRPTAPPSAGVVNGLAVTGAGGDVLFVEATAMDGEQGLTVTGQLGDVMKESAQIALSYVRANGEELGIDAGGARPTRSTCTSRPAPSPRTARRPASR